MSNVDLTQLAIDRGSENQPGKRRRSVFTRYVLPALLLMGFVALIGWASRDYIFPRRSVTVVPVFSTTSEVRQEGTSLFQAAGWIEPRPTPIRVAALAPGVVSELLVVEDQQVKKGDVIAELVADDARLRLQKAKADMALREAELEEATAVLTAATTRFEQPVHLQAELSQSNAALAKVETEFQNLPFQLESAKADFQALHQDYKSKQASKGVVAGSKIDIARGKSETAKAMVEQLTNRKDSLEQERTALSKRRDALKTQLKLLASETQEKSSANARLKQCAARLEQTKVAVAQAQLELDRMTIRAPVTGRIYHLLGHPGSRLGSGMSQMEGHDGSSIVTMYRPDMLQVRVDVRFDDLPRIHLKQPVSLRNAATSEEIMGEVLFVSSEADIQKNTLEVKVAIPNPPRAFRPEMLVDVTFREPKRSIEDSDAETKTELKIFVPTALVIDGESGSSVWVADQSAGLAVLQSIQTGEKSDNGMIEVTEGLTVASRLIVGGRNGLKPGDRIKITGEEPAR